MAMSIVGRYNLASTGTVGVMISDGVLIYRSSNTTLRKAIFGVSDTVLTTGLSVGSFSMIETHRSMDYVPVGDGFVVVSIKGSTTSTAQAPVQAVNVVTGAVTTYYYSVTGVVFQPGYGHGICRAFTRGGNYYVVTFGSDGGNLGTATRHEVYGQITSAGLINLTVYDRSYSDGLISPELADVQGLKANSRYAMHNSGYKFYKHYFNGAVADYTGFQIPSTYGGKSLRLQGQQDGWPAYFAEDDNYIHGWVFNITDSVMGAVRIDKSTGVYDINTNIGISVPYGTKCEDAFAFHAGAQRRYFSGGNKQGTLYASAAWPVTNTEFIVLDTSSATVMPGLWLFPPYIYAFIHSGLQGPQLVKIYDSKIDPSVDQRLPAGGGREEEAYIMSILR